MKLVIVESPTKAKTLSGILGKQYTIKASMGHIRDLPKKGLGVDIEHNYQPEYEIPDKSKKTIAELKKYATEADQIILATDPDREGEAISWHLREILEGRTDKKAKKAPGRSKKESTKTTKSAKALDATPTEAVSTLETSLDKRYSRVVFHELTKAAIEEAFNHPGALNLDLVDAQQARRVLDRLVGYKLSPLLWKKVRFGLSAGRVQSVAVRIIVERERERLAFKPVEYWSVFGDFSNTAKHIITAEAVEKDGKKLEIKTEAEAKQVEADTKGDSYKVSSIKKTERQRKAYPPLKTSTLQQMGANVFGFSAKKTMMAAQKLFEHGLITYHRTDSLNLSPVFIEAAREFIGNTMGKQYLPKEGTNYKTNAKNAQEAHEAIRPTNVSLTPQEFPHQKMTEDEYKVYTLIWKRSLECQMLPAVYDQTSLQISSKKGYVFRASGSIVKFAGWLAVADFIKFSTDEDEISKLDEFTENETVTLEKLKMDQHFTQAPARYSDASLIKALEELGIGRPSTYAPTISTIQARGYVTKEGRYFVPADVAFVVTDLLVQHFPNIVDYQFTAEMEKQLDEIAEGQRKWVPVIREFYEPFEKIVLEKDKTLQKSEVTNLGESSELCPKCGRTLIFKLGKYGKFLSCSGYPDHCDYAKPIMEVLADGTTTDSNGATVAGGIPNLGKCPDCADGLLIMRQGKFGKFIGCSNYPKCKHIEKFLEKIGMQCPKCEKGDVVIKKARGRTFYGCSCYPDCDYSSWKNPKPNPNAEEGEIVTTLEGTGDVA